MADEENIETPEVTELPTQPDGLSDQLRSTYDGLPAAQRAVIAVVAIAGGEQLEEGEDHEGREEALPYPGRWR